MRIADEDTHRALSYVDNVSRFGHKLSVVDFDAFVARPTRIGPTVSSPITKGIENMSRMMWTLTGPGETAHAWLNRLGWIKIEEDGPAQWLHLTGLGRAVLKSLEEESIEPESLVTVLSDEGGVAYPLVISALAQRGEALLIDPYFPLESWMHIVGYTTITRLLVSPRADVPGLATALDVLPSDRKFAIRISDEVHDRFCIPSSGSIDHLGTSLNGVGKRFSVMSSIVPPEADGIRRELEKKWRSASRMPGDVPRRKSTAKSSTRPSSRSSAKKG